MRIVTFAAAIALLATPAAAQVAVASKKATPQPMPTFSQVDIPFFSGGRPLLSQSLVVMVG